MGDFGQNAPEHERQLQGVEDPLQEAGHFCLDGGVPRMRRPGAMGLALTAFEIWRRLPPAQRRMLLEGARKQAPKAAAAATHVLARAEAPASALAS
jgi:hypothetical protein